LEARKLGEQNLDEAAQLGKMIGHPERVPVCRDKSKDLHLFFMPGGTAYWLLAIGYQLPLESAF
jgi:hypothetical protein